MSNYQGNIIIKNPATPTGPFENGSAPGIWTLSEAMTFKRQGIWPTQGVQGADPYFNYVSLLLSTTSLSNANNNLFVDSSGAFNPISRNGNATQGSATPYSANWSNYFDGNGDYLSVPNSASLDFGTGDFTLEAWVYFASLSGRNSLFGGNTTGGFDLQLSTPTNLISLGRSDVAYDFSSSFTFAVGQWYHVAITRASGTARCFVNGALINSASNTVSYSQAGGQTLIGASVSSGSVFHAINGYVSNARIVKGTAVYTSAFTPSTTNLTAISGTSLLTCQSNRFRDASSNNFTITRNGDVRVTDFAPFSPGSPGITYNQSDITNWSGYFDGSGDYLYAPNNTALDIWDNGSSSFTVEAWIFATASIPNNVSIVGKATLDGNTPFNGWAFQVFSGCLNVNTASNNRLFTNSTAVPLNQWVHVALVKSGSTISIYQNGTRVSTITNTSTYSNTADQLHIATDRNPAGSSLTGYMSNLRIVKGVAVYDPTQSTLTVPTSALTAVSGTSLLTLQNAAFTDNSSNKFLLTQYGNVTVTGNSPFNAVGYWSNYFDGSSTLSFSSISLAGDFTIEGWVYYTSTSGNPTLIGENPPNNQALRRLNGKHYFYFQGPSITGTIDLPANQWVHLAVTRSSGTVRIFTNGVLDGSASMNGTYSVFCLGGVDTSTDRLTGYASNVRVVNGTALYTATFTPSTTPLTAVSGTTLLTAQNGTFKDNSTNNRTLTINGSPTVQSFDPFYTSTIASNGGSMYFGSNATYLSSPSVPSLGLGTSAFTFECWVYPNTYPNDSYLISVIGNNSYSMSLQIRNAQVAAHLYTGSHSDVQFTDTAPVLNAWNHIAISRVGNTLYGFINGVRSSVTASVTASFGTTGYLDFCNSAYRGFITDARVTTGSAVYSSATYTVPTAPLTPTSATGLLLNGMNAGIYDATTINDMTAFGNAQVTTAVSKYGGSSVYFDGSGDYLVVPDNDAFNMGSGNFTAEAWIYPLSLANEAMIMGQWSGDLGGTGLNWALMFSSGSTGYLRLITSSNGSSVLFDLSTSTTSFTMATNAWQHIAAVRNGNAFTIYVDGVARAATTNSSALYNATNSFTIGAESNTQTQYFNGYIDDLRITKGVARYTSNFTPPTTAFPLY